MTTSIYTIDADGKLFRTDPDGLIWSIPMVEGNSDYQAYLASLEA
jgi:hypothetical protein